MDLIWKKKLQDASVLYVTDRMVCVICLTVSLLMTFNQSVSYCSQRPD